MALGRTIQRRRDLATPPAWVSRGGMTSTTVEVMAMPLYFFLFQLPSLSH
jgi:hypothetical protein